MPIFESFDGVNFSTIDLSLAFIPLSNLFTKCKILLTDHASDHQAINMRFQILIKEDQAPLSRLYIKKPTGQVFKKV